MPDLLARPSHNAAPAGPPAVPQPLGDELLEREVCEVMTPGCVAISEDASVAQAAHALAARGVHAGGMTTDAQVREVMRPGVVAVPEDASVLEARRAMQSHGVHAVLVVERAYGRPLGLVTARGLLSWLDRDETAGYARDAISQAPVWILPTATVREAAEVLLEPGITHVLVRRRDEEMPEGVLTAADLLPTGEPAR